MKKTKIVVGICLIVQAIAFLALFLIYWERKRSLAKTFAAFAAVGGGVGAFLIYQAKNKPSLPLGSLFDDEDDDFEGSFKEDDIFCDFEESEPEIEVEVKE
ncbi:MAG: hypothetical protein WCR95_07530 [Eubacteriales bacterium]